MDKGKRGKSGVSLLLSPCGEMREREETAVDRSSGALIEAMRYVTMAACHRLNGWMWEDGKASVGGRKGDKSRVQAGHAARPASAASYLSRQNTENKTKDDEVNGQGEKGRVPRPHTGINIIYFFVTMTTVKKTTMVRRKYICVYTADLTS